MQDFFQTWKGYLLYRYANKPLPPMGSKNFFLAAKTGRKKGISGMCGHALMLWSFGFRPFFQKYPVTAQFLCWKARPPCSIHIPAGSVRATARLFAAAVPVGL